MKPSKTFLISLAAIAVIVPVVAIQNLVRAHYPSAGDSTWNSLRQIDSAKQQWMLNLGKMPGDIPSLNDLLPYLSSSFTNCYQTNGVVVCPNGTIFFIGRIGQPAAAKRGEKTYP